MGPFSPGFSALMAYISVIEDFQILAGRTTVRSCMSEVGACVLPEGRREGGPELGEKDPTRTKSFLELSFPALGGWVGFRSCAGKAREATLGSLPVTLFLPNSNPGCRNRASDTLRPGPLT